MLRPVEALLVIARTVAAGAVASNSRAAEAHTTDKRCVGKGLGHARHFLILDGALVNGIRVGGHAAAANIKAGWVGR